jgi:hypothetical protein
MIHEFPEIGIAFSGRCLYAFCDALLKVLYHIEALFSAFLAAL